MRNVCRQVITVAVLAGTLGLGVATGARAQTPVESSVEARFQLDLVVPEAVVKTYLPPGWSLNVATQGAAKDCNLRVIFVDRLTVHGPDGRPVGKGSNRLVYLAVPARDAAGANVQLIIGGLTGDPADAPGSFGNYIHATTATGARRVQAEAGGVTETQDWVFRAASGERIEMHITFERGVANRNQPNEVKFYSAINPSTYQISRQEQVLEILRNATTNPPDRVKQYSFTGSGGSFAKLFDGTEKTVSWDNIIWISRTVLRP